MQNNYNINICQHLHITKRSNVYSTLQINATVKLVKYPYPNNENIFSLKMYYWSRNIMLVGLCVGISPVRRTHENS